MAGSDTPRTDAIFPLISGCPVVVPESIYELREKFEELERDLAAANAEREELKRDAERYRWLREHCNSMSLDPPLTVAQVKGYGLDAWSGDNLDVAIDAAIAAREGKA